MADVVRTRRSVVVIACRADEAGRGVLNAIAREAHLRWGWSICYFGKLPEVRMIEQVQPDGIIIQSAGELVAPPAMIERGIPVVQFNYSEPAHAHGHVCSSDDEAIGRVAARYFLDRGFSRLGYYGQRDDYGQRRRAGFQAVVREVGRDYSECLWDASSAGWDYEQRIAMTMEWLASLRYPVGVLAMLDLFAERIFEACRRLGLRIPEDVSLVGVGNDDHLCQMVWPQLSSIRLDTDRIGRAAAGLLARLMDGESAPAQPALIPPLGVVTRQSSDSTAIEDPHVVQALRYIRDHIQEPFQIDDLLEAATISRRSLERRFQESLGRSPSAEVRRMRIDRAKLLLQDSDLPVQEVARLCGFTGPNPLTVHFKEETGQTPGAFRQALRRP